MPETKILIIGGGSSGLSMAGALKKYGLNPVILDAGSRTGDVWRKRYDRLHLHTIRGLSYSTHKKMPDTYPRYVSKDEFADYLENYADEFDVDIRYDCTVTHISKDDDRYLVETENGDTWQSEHLVIATGVNRVPYTPTWNGMENFKGEIVHSSTHKTGKDHAGKRVLVVGIGNSGAEICVDCIENGASYVANSIRTYPTIVKRDMLGIPIHAWGVALFKLPMAVKEWLLKVIVGIEVGDLSQYGIKAPEWSVFKDGRIPMIDVGYLDTLKQGKIHVKRDIDCFTETGVKFTDGTQEDFDVVIAGTGYRTGLTDILDIPDVIDSDGTVLSANGADTPHKGLWFIGLLSSPAGVLMAARVQSQRFAEKIAADYGISQSVTA